MRKYFIIAFALIFALGGCSKTSESQFKKAVRQNAAGDIEAALKTYHAILRADANYFPALLNRAIVYEQMGEPDYARADYERAFSIDPTNPDLLNNMGAFYVSRVQPVLGNYYLNKAIEARPSFLSAYLNRARALERQNMFSSALADVETALEINPTYRPAVELRGIIQLRRADWLNAADSFSEAIDMAPGDAKNYFRRGVALRGAGHYPNALQDFNSAIALNPDYVDALYNRAELNFKNGDQYAALDDLNRIKTINNRYVPAYELSGDIYAIEDPVQAVANYLAARQLDPGQRRYSAKINLMRTVEGRRHVITRTFKE